LDYLTGKSRPARLHEVTLALCAEGLVAGGLAANEAEARQKLERALADGSAADRFAKMVRLLGGPSDLFESPDKHLDRAPLVVALKAPRAGFVSSFDTRALGLAVVALGGGRLRSDAVIDPAVGFTDIVELGTPVRAGDPLLMIHARTEEGARIAAEMAGRAVGIADQAPALPELIVKRISSKG
jgi:thymidine phosphorylase